MAESVTRVVVKKDAPKRTRAFSTRAKTGCKTCKVRHVKCDEGRPGCKKCASTGRQCDGYAHCTPSPNPKPSTISSSHIQKSFAGLRYRLPPMIPEFLSPSVFASEQERHSFQFFHTQTAPQLEGCFKSKFWNHFVLEASHREAAVRHAAIALGSMHERFEVDDQFLISVEEDTEDFAVRHYVEAINCLVQPNMCLNNRHTRESANVALTTCILFICFETIRGQHNSALAHIDGGIRILSEMQSSQGPEDISINPQSDNNNIPVSIFRTLFSRLDTQASIVTSRARIIDGYKPTSLPSPIPNMFYNLEEAREALDSVWSYNARNILSCSMYNGIPLPLTPDPDSAIQLSTRLKSWSQAFDSYLRTSHGRNGLGLINFVDEKAINMLRIHETVTQILLSASTALNPSEMFWDSFMFQYEEVTKWAAEIIQASSEIDTGSTKSSAFTLDSGIIQPLFLVATKCRYRNIRRKAIALLNQAKRQEGVWNSRLTARVAERIVEVEDYGLTEEEEIVPDSNRIRDVNMRFEFEVCKERRAWLRFRHAYFPICEAGEWIGLHQNGLSDLADVYGNDMTGCGSTTSIESYEIDNGANMMMRNL